MEALTRRALQVSRWLKVGVLLDSIELEALLEHLPELTLYATGRVMHDEKPLDRSQFCALYRAYLDGAALPSISLSSSPSCIEKHSSRNLLLPVAPVIIARPHTISYSSLDGKVRSMVRGPTAIPWGIQFSYPQLYGNPKTGDIERIDDTFPNTAPFFRLQRWIRYHTRAACLLIDGKRINASCRIGNNAPTREVTL